MDMYDDMEWWEKTLYRIGAFTSAALLPITIPVVIGIAIWMAIKEKKIRVGLVYLRAIPIQIKFCIDHNLLEYCVETERYGEDLEDALDD